MAGFQTRMMRAAGRLNNWLYRRSGGRLMGRVRGMPVLLLTVAGRRTGTPHTTPVVYLEDAGRYVVTGSAGGSPSEPQWFRNLRRAERAVVEIGRDRIDVAVAVAGPGDRTVLWERLIAKAPFFANYQAKVQREIPMAVLTPVGSVA
jgi:F420H(2)-dependent quinone reductase